MPRLLETFWKPQKYGKQLKNYPKVKGDDVRKRKAINFADGITLNDQILI